MTQKRKKIIRTIFLFGIGITIFFVVIDTVVMPRYVQHGKTIRIPNVVGVQLEEAIKTLREIGVQPKEAERKQDRTHPVGTVIYQNPPAGTEVKQGRGVYLTISGGEQLVVVPNLRGKSIREATFTLERYGLRIGAIHYEPSEEFFENTIIQQEPIAGQRVSLNATINVVVSQGRPGEKELVPNVVGKTLSEAEKILMQSSFTLGKITEQTSLSLLPNTVLEQYPHAGELARKGQPIDLIIAQKTETKPNEEF